MLHFEQCPYVPDKLLNTYLSFKNSISTCWLKCQAWVSANHVRPRLREVLLFPESLTPETRTVLWRAGRMPLSSRFQVIWFLAAVLGLFRKPVTPKDSVYLCTVACQRACSTE